MFADIPYYWEKLMYPAFFATVRMGLGTMVIGMVLGFVLSIFLTLYHPDRKSVV